MATQTVGNGNGQANGMSRQSTLGVGVRVGWPTERWLGAIIIMALGILILIRFGFRGVGISGTAGANVRL